MQDFLAEKIILLTKGQLVSALSYTLETELAVEIYRVLFMFSVKSYQGSCKLAEAKKDKLLTLLIGIP